MFSGSLVALVTPLRVNGAIDFAAWSRLIDFHARNGTRGIVVGGTTGESATLSELELQELTQRACMQVAGTHPTAQKLTPEHGSPQRPGTLAAGRMQVIAGAGTSSTTSTIERVRRLCELPIDGLLVVTPAYNKPTQEGLYRHFAAVAQAAEGVPIIAYNVPSRTAVDMLPATTARLSQLPGIAGIKEAVAQIERIRELLKTCREGFSILSGDDATAREAMLAGAHGVISVTANVAPRACADMVAAATSGESDRAAAIDATLAALHRDLFVETNPIPVKWALAQMGLIQGSLRLPLTELSASHVSTVQAAFKAAGIVLNSPEGRYAQ